MNVVEAYARMQHCRDLATFYRRWATSEAAGMPLNSMLSGLREGGSAAPREPAGTTINKASRDLLANRTAANRTDMGLAHSN